MIIKSIRLKFYFLCLLSIAMLPTVAQAAIINLGAVLDGGQEVPPTLSAGTGSATITLDDLTNELSWNIIFSDLSGPAVGAHFHGPAPAGINAGVQVNIGAVSGLFSPMIGSSVINDSQESDLLAGLWYINIHTAEFPGGEIRGQVNVVPLPAATWLFGSGIVMIYGLLRRKPQV